MKSQANIPDSPHPRILIIGGGFGGINLARILKHKPFQVVMVDRNNYHLFQPLLYQVSTAGLEPDSIAFPLRGVVDKQKNFIFRMAEVNSVLPSEKKVTTSIGDISYDYLVIATGSNSNFFGMKGFEEHAIGMKSLLEAIQIRNYVLQEFERVLLLKDSNEARKSMNFVMVGAGPTGVELSGAFAELKNKVLPRDYPEISSDIMNVYLVEALPRVLPPFSEKSSERTMKELLKLGVNVKVNTPVEDYDGKVLTLKGGEKIESSCVIWSAGVKGVPISGLPENVVQKNGRVTVNGFNQVEGFDNIFAIGDVAQLVDKDHPKGYPMVAQVAIQQGKNVAKNLIRQHQNKSMKAFDYYDKGSMATVGRNYAIAETMGLKLAGFIAWLAWMWVHLLFLMGFRNKLVVFINWVYRYFTYERGSRIILKRGVANIQKLAKTVIEENNPTVTKTDDIPESEQKPYLEAAAKGNS